MATVAITDMTPRAYVLATMDAITVSHFVGGLVKSPFLALAIGLIACGQGLATQGGAAAVGARTTTAVVLAIFGVIVINALFTLFLRGDGRLIMPPSRPHIIVEDLRIGWGTRVLMEHVSFEVERGTTLAILGGSGQRQEHTAAIPDRARAADGRSNRHRRRRRAAPLRGRAAVRRSLSVRRALQLHDAG